MTQTHFGMVYKDGKCGPSLDLDEIKGQFEWDLKLFQTDYTDFGLIHCIDDMEQLDAVLHGGVWAYMKTLKADGVVRHLGFSSHTPDIARRILDTGMIDLFMFSINPAYDYENNASEAAERAKLYRDCERMGVGISVMKPFAGGQLLDANRSHFKHALSHVQCMQYALDRPGVLTVLPGVRNMEDLRTVLRYPEASAEERDYSVIGGFTPQDAQGVCVYCNHCLPCPMDLNVGLINKYYDLARAGDEMAADHYRQLPVKADACVQCGHCESSCPFKVAQMARMEEIAKYFA